MNAISPRRLWALCKKESWQIVRDPSSVLIAFIMPVVMLFVFGYAVNLDASNVRTGLLQEDSGAAAQSFSATLAASPALQVHRVASRDALMAEMMAGRLRGGIVINGDFSQQVASGNAAGAVQIITDGSEPNTAAFLGNYVNAIWLGWAGKYLPTGIAAPQISTRAWFNPSTVSRNYLVPGSISVVMTIIGALLTSLVVAREWERGTMEALLATPVTRAELILSKILPYYVLGLAAMLLCLLVATQIMHVPYRGSLFALWLMTSLFLACALGNGLFLSTVTRNQFNAAQAALTSAFLPALMLSGFVFEIGSMPRWLQVLTYIIPARYFSASLQTLFQAGDLWPILLTEAACLALMAAFWLGLTARKTRRSLD